MVGEKGGWNNRSYCNEMCACARDCMRALMREFEKVLF